MSVKISTAFPSQYRKCADLNGKPWDMKIRTVVLEDLGQGSDKEEKPVVYFHKGQKGLVLNKTNATTIAKVYGDDTSAWTGQDGGEPRAAGEQDPGPPFRELGDEIVQVVDPSCGPFSFRVP